MASGRRAVVRCASAALAAGLSMSAVVSNVGAMAPQAPLGSWTELGPRNVGGRTVAFVFHPDFAANRTFYAAAAGGGVWRSSDAGGSWLSLTDGLFALNATTLAMPAADPTTMYLGTGAGYEELRSLRAADVYKTTDAGATWRRLTGLATIAVRKLAVSPLQPEKVYAATNLGLWRSTDAGETWTRLLTPGFGAGNISFDGCVDVAVRSGTSGDDVLAACGLQSSTTSPAAAVYHNPKVDTQPTAWRKVLSDPDMGRTSLALAPSDSTVVYALMAHHETGRLLSFQRSTDGGGTWTVRHAFAGGSAATSVGDLLLSPTEDACVGMGPGSGLLAQSLAVDPLDPDRVWAGGVRLFRSDDGGVTWGSVDPVSGPAEGIHSTDHVIAFPPDYDGAANKNVYVGNDGGVWRVDDALATTTRSLQGANSICDGDTANTFSFAQRVSGYAVTRFVSGAVFGSDDAYLGGTQGNGTLLGRDATPGVWSTILGGGSDAGAVAVDPTNNDVVYASRAGGALRKSTDGGATFQSASAGLADSGFLPVAPLAMDPSDPLQLWTAGGAIWRSTNGGGSWQRASTVNENEVDDVDSAGAIAVAPGNPNHVLVGGTVLGRIYRSDTALTTTGATRWSSTYVGGEIGSIVFDPVDENLAYAASSGPYWRGGRASTDGGSTWEPLQVPFVPYSIVVDTAGRLYAGTEHGVYSSWNGGRTWELENGTPRARARRLVLNGTTLYAFTDGRGAWRVSLPPPPPPPSLTIEDVSLIEGNTGTKSAVFAVKLSGPATRIVSVQYATGGGSAAAGEDYTSVSGRLSFGRGETEASISVPVRGDLEVEETETFEVTLSAPAHATLDDATAVGTIAADDSAGSLSLSASRYTVSEGSPFTLVRVTRSFASAGSTATVGYQTSEGSASSPGDFTGTASTLSFGPGVTTQTIRVPITKDGEFEPTEVFGLKLLNPSAGARLGFVSSAIVLIADDDPVPVLAVGALAYSVTETGPAAIVTLRRSGSTSGAASVDYTTVDGTASAGSDYASTSGILEFEAGAVTKTITVPITDDSLYEPAETFKVTLLNPRRAVLRSGKTATVTIRDDDQGLSFGTAASMVSEGGRTAVVTVRRSGGATGELSVDYAATGGTATAGTDYSITPTRLVFGPGVMTLSFPVTILNDAQSEGSETIELALANASPASAIAAPAAMVLTIDDDEPVFRFGAPAYRAPELARRATILVRRTGPLGGPALVDYVVSGGTATGGGVDYTLDDGTLSFGPGVAVKSLTVDLTADGHYEPEETVVLALQQHPGSPPIGSPGTTTLTIVNGNKAGTAQFTAEVFGGDAERGEVVVAVSRTGGNAHFESVVVTPSDGTAQAGVDYVATPITVVFQYPGTTTEMVRIPVFATGTGSKYFNVQLSSPTGTIIGPRNSAEVWQFE